MRLAKLQGHYYGMVGDDWFTTNTNVDHEGDFMMLFNKGSQCLYEHLDPTEKNRILWLYVKTQRDRLNA